jgi:Flp pilus assembly protein TadB
MTTVERPVQRTGAGVELAGTVWPLFKLEALAAGVLVLFVVALITASAQTAVLTAAAVATVFWVLGAARNHRAPPR